MNENKTMFNLGLTVRSTYALSTILILPSVLASRLKNQAAYSEVRYKGPVRFQHFCTSLCILAELKAGLLFFFQFHFFDLKECASD